MRNPFEVYTSLKDGKDARPLDWEESALDDRSFVEGFADEERQPKNIFWMWTMLTVVFLAMGIKVFTLQVVKGTSYRSMSENNRVRRQTLLAPRGLIVDRNNETLAQNTASFNLVVVPFDLPKEGLDEELKSLAETFGLDLGELQKQIKAVNRKSFEPVVIKQDISVEQSILFDTQSTRYVGFDVQKLPIREYLEPEVFSHVLGYTGIVSPEEKKTLDPDIYDANDYIGKLGIEARYEKYLHGVNGYDQIEVDATGKLTQVLGQLDPLPGSRLVLNIDKGLQEQLYRTLETGPGTHRGAAIALDPRNGQVLALVSVPGFNNNLFAHGIKFGDYNKLLQDKALPLFNRTIAGTYPPGSTSKMMTAIAGLQEGIVDEHTVIVDNGVITVPNQYGGAGYQFRGWKLSGLGPMTVRSAIAQSSDIYFYEVAGGPPNGAWPGLGPDKLATYFRKFGLGKPTGIDIQGEKPGTVPDPAWKMKYHNNDPLLGKWYLGDTYHIGIGQGDLLTTPLQVAMWTAAIANGGVAYKPQIAQKAVDSSGRVLFESKPEVLLSGIASEKNLKIVQEGMRETVLSGTARSLQVLPFSSAGKTGTSQVDGSDPSRTHSWFTVYAPYENPQIVVTVLVEAGGEGHAAAEPIARDVLKWWAEHRYNKK